MSLTKRKQVFITASCLAVLLGGGFLGAQSVIYPQHFNLSEVRLLDSPFKTAMLTNYELLLKYDADRLMTPFIRQAGLSKDSSSKYAGWEKDHPSFENWGLPSWSLEGHVGGHYLTALSLAYASCEDEAMRAKLKERLDYCVDILDDCQNAYDKDRKGLRGFIGGQPINQVWTGLYSRNLDAFRQYGGWVPFYCEHKVLAGLRDAWVYAGNEKAKQCFKELSDWAVAVVSKLTDADMQAVLAWEHGGMNEVLADAYSIFGDKKYLKAAKKYCHAFEVDGMQGKPGQYNKAFLDGQHANTQVPKFIGFERISELDKGGDKSKLRVAAVNFWDDVATNRTVCIGGNSVSEHFLSADRGSQYINNMDGPESCNTNNMLKLSEMMFDRTHEAQYVDFYEQAMWNHILSTQDPDTGGYVYFTTLRPQGYRIYSTVNEGMWCCVGTGMENHSKYGHFIYTHEGDTLYVNLFTASKLENATFAVTQQTSFPYSPSTKLTIDKGGSFTLAIRHPAWVGKDFAVSVNGEVQKVSGAKGKAFYVTLKRNWAKGDVVEVSLPMSLRYEECPNYSDYIAFKYGPILLAAKTTASSEQEAEETGLPYEKLQNEYADASRMGHAPGSMAAMRSLSSAPKILGKRADTLKKVKAVNKGELKFSLDCGDAKLTLQPFYSIHHARYSCYWYQQTEEAYASSNMAKQDALAQALEDRTIDFVATGEQQSEAGHDAKYSLDSNTGSYNGETFRDTAPKGYVQYVLQNPDGETQKLAIGLRFTSADAGRRADLSVDGKSVSSISVSSRSGTDDGFYMQEYAIPESLMLDENGEAKATLTVRIKASNDTMCPGLYGIRFLRGYEEREYVFKASEWITGDSVRIVQKNISYDAGKNEITLKAGKGANNVCLMLDFENTQYTVGKDQKYLVVRGTNLTTGANAAFLWWLNGVNHGSSVKPTFTKTAKGGQTVFVWDMTQSGLFEETGERYSVCKGSTIFGLTSSTGTSTITYIGFSSTPDDSNAK